MAEAGRLFRTRRGSETWWFAGTVVLALVSGPTGCTDGGASTPTVMDAAVHDSAGGSGAGDVAQSTDAGGVPDAGTHDAVVVDAGTDVADTSDGTAASCPEGQTPCLDENGLNDPSLCAGQPDTECVDGCCVPVFRCTSDDDCASFAGDADMGCPDGRFACRCDTSTGTCWQWTCARSEDCGGGMVCATGACVPAPTSWAAVVRGRPVVVTPGATVQLHGVLVGGDGGAAVRAPQAPEWQSSDEGVVAVDASGLLTGGSQAGTAEVRMRGDGSDWSEPVAVFNPGTAPAGGVRVVAVDDATRTPVEGWVAVTLADGTIAGSPLQDGVAFFGGVEPPVDVHVFSPDHQYISWIGLDQADIVVLVPRRFNVDLDISPDGTLDPAAQVFEGKGSILTGSPDFSDYYKPGEIELAIGNSAVTDGLFTFDLPVILGPNVRRYFDPEAPTSLFDPDKPIELPGGVTLAIGFPVISTYWLAAPAGRHPLWTLGGRVALGDEGLGEKVSAIIDGAKGGNLDVTEIVAALLPLFDRFYSGVAWADFAEEPDFANPPQLDLALQVPLSHRLAIEVGPLPELGAPDLWADAAFVIGGASLPSGELVPLGLTAGTDKESADATPDGIVDGDPGTPGVQPLRIAMAAPHGGVQGDGTRAVIAAVAAAIDTKGNSGKLQGGSGVLTDIELPAASPPGATPPSVTLDPFLPLAAATSWDPATRTIGIESVEGTQWTRVVFDAADGWTWHVWVPAGTSSAVLPVPSDVTGQADLPDRAAEASHYVVNAFELREGLGAGALVTPGTAQHEGLLRAVHRASYVRLDAPVSDTSGAQTK